MPHRFAAALVAVLVLAHLTVAFASETGIASWYGPGFHGRKTASGERFNQNAMTCAHKAPMKLGTVVRVTHLRTGRSVVCRVNDRGPYAGGRIIDLSKAAAAHLGMIGTGTARVRVDILH